MYSAGGLGALSGFKPSAMPSTVVYQMGLKVLHHMKFYLLETLHTRGGNEVIVSIWTCYKAQTDSLALPSPNVAVANVYY